PRMMRLVIFVPCDPLAERNRAGAEEIYLMSAGALGSDNDATHVCGTDRFVALDVPQRCREWPRSTRQRVPQLIDARGPQRAQQFWSIEPASTPGHSKSAELMAQLGQ